MSQRVRPSAGPVGPCGLRSFSSVQRPLGLYVCCRAYPHHQSCSVTELMTIDEIIENFSLLEEWDDRYRYVIELGKTLAPLGERDRSEANKVQGCASQVWLATAVRPNGADGPVLNFIGDSDAHIVRGLIAILFTMFSGRHAREILATDANAIFEQLGLREHLTPQRSNGFRSMVERIRSDARVAQARSQDGVRVG
jgi:cysteine desulfuration protein SufE